MSIYRPRKPSNGKGAPSQFLMFCISVWEMLFNGKFPFQDTNTIKWKCGAAGYSAPWVNPGSSSGGKGGGGGFMGEYDPTVAYTTGQTFKITTPLTITIASVNYIIAAGYWGVRPAASVVDSQGFGPWAGSLPVNPTTAGIDMDKMFFNAENTAPTMGTGLNAKLYAELITSSCTT